MTAISVCTYYGLGKESSAKYRSADETEEKLNDQTKELRFHLVNKTVFAYMFKLNRCLL